MDVDKKTGLFTGVRLLIDETDALRFGMVGAFGSVKDRGIVRLTLDLRYLAWEQDETSITIELSELRADHLADQLNTVIGQLEHLRTLLRFGHLTPDALHDTAELESLANAPLLPQPQA